MPLLGKMGSLRDHRALVCASDKIPVDTQRVIEKDRGRAGPVRGARGSLGHRTSRLLPIDECENERRDLNCPVSTVTEESDSDSFRQWARRWIAGNRFPSLTAQEGVGAAIAKARTKFVTPMAFRIPSSQNVFTPKKWTFDKSGRRGQASRAAAGPGLLVEAGGGAAVTSEGRVSRGGGAVAMSEGHVSRGGGAAAMSEGHVSRGGGAAAMSEGHVSGGGGAAAMSEGHVSGGGGAAAMSEAHPTEGAPIAAPRLQEAHEILDVSETISDATLIEFVNAVFPDGILTAMRLAMPEVMQHFENETPLEDSEVASRDLVGMRVLFPCFPIADPLILKEADLSAYERRHDWRPLHHKERDRAARDLCCGGHEGKAADEPCVCGAGRASPSALQRPRPGHGHSECRVCLLLRTQVPPAGPVGGGDLRGPYRLSCTCPTN